MSVEGSQGLVEFAPGYFISPDGGFHTRNRHTGKLFRMSPTGGRRVQIKIDGLYRSFYARDLVRVHFGIDLPRPILNPNFDPAKDPSRTRECAPDKCLAPQLGPCEWRDIVGGNYSVTRCGRVRSNDHLDRFRRIVNGRELTRDMSTTGYKRVAVRHNGQTKQYVQWLVAEAFIGPRPPGLHINHIDGNKLNNHASNLEYVTHAENMRHAKRMGLTPTVTVNAKLNPNLVRQIRESLKTAPNTVVVARRFGVSRTAISNIAAGKSWKHVS